MKDKPGESYTLYKSTLRFRLPTWLYPGAALILALVTGSNLLAQTRQSSSGQRTSLLRKQQIHMTPDQIVKALSAHSREPLAGLTELPEGTVPAIEKSLPGMDTESREMTISLLVHTRDRHSGELLLKLTQDHEGMVSGAAAQGLVSLPGRPGLKALIQVATGHPDPQVRYYLYLAAGVTGETVNIPTLKAALHSEKDAEALRAARAGLLKLGDRSEQEAYLADLKETAADEAMEAIDRLIYIHDQHLSVGLLPWLDNKDPVVGVGLGSHRRMARMCDVAVWAVHKLGIALAPAPEKLNIFSEHQIHQAKAAILALQKH